MLGAEICRLISRKCSFFYALSALVCRVLFHKFCIYARACLSSSLRLCVCVRVCVCQSGMVACHHDVSV